jgi:energy-coupling factor transporter ATP-binding protein EcfA2
LLALEARIVTNCPLLDRRLDYLMHDAQQDFPVTGRLRYEAILEGREYRIAEGGRAVKVEYDALAALNFLHVDCFARAYAALPPGTVFLHAASGRIAGRRFLLIGESGAGKTTLIMQLARCGATVEGDELAALTPLGVTAMPRRFHVKGRSLAKLPWLEHEAKRLPYFDHGDGTRIFSVAPSELGFAWDIRCGPVDAVFFLESNHDGEPRIEAIPHHRMVELAISEARLIDRRDRRWLGPLCAMLDGAATRKLIVGDLDSTARMLILNLSEMPILA